jgi:hypothetical protein
MGVFTIHKADHTGVFFAVTGHIVKITTDDNISKDKTVAGIDGTPTE